MSLVLVLAFVALMIAVIPVAHALVRPGGRRRGARAAAEKSSASASRRSRMRRFSCEWICDTRLSDTSSTSPISRSVRFFT